MDEENQKVVKHDSDDDRNIFIWMKDQFMRFISKGERSFLLSRILKYLLVQRSLVNPDIGIVIKCFAYIITPPVIEDLPIDTFTFFLLFFLFKVISVISFIHFMNAVRKTQEDRAIACVCSLDMFDCIDLTSHYHFYTLMMIYLNILYDLYVLLCLQYSQVLRESSQLNTVIGLEYSIFLNFGLIIVFPFLYCLTLFFCCCQKKKVDMNSIQTLSTAAADVSTRASTTATAI